MSRFRLRRPSSPPRRTFLSPVDIAALETATQGSLDVTKNLRIAFTMDDESGGTVRADVTPYVLDLYEDTDGTLHTSPSVMHTADGLRTGTNFGFASTGKKFTPGTPDMFPTDFTYPFSFVWVGIIEDTSEDRGVWELNVVGSGGIGMDIVGGNLRGFVDLDNNSYEDIQSPAITGTQQVVCGVYRATDDREYYIDGVSVLQSTSDEPNPPDFEDLEIGRTSPFSNPGEVTHQLLLFYERDITSDVSAITSAIQNDWTSILEDRGDYLSVYPGIKRSIFTSLDVGQNRKDTGTSINIQQANGYSGQPKITTREWNGEVWQVATSWIDDDTDTDESYARVSYRTLSDTSWTSHDFPSYTSDEDGHNQATVVIDPRTGRLLWTGGYHFVEAQGFVSDDPIDQWDGSITDLTFPSTSMATYPHWVIVDDVPYLSLRIQDDYRVLWGWEDTGTAALSESVPKAHETIATTYDPDGTTGVSLKPYHPRPVVHNGEVYYTLMYKSTGISSNGGNESNTRLSFIRVDPAAQTARKQDGTSVSLPVTYDTVEVIEDIPVDNGFINAGMRSIEVIDGDPHVTYTKRDGNGNNQIFHRYWSGGSWTAAASVTQQTGFSYITDNIGRSPVRSRGDMLYDDSSGRLYVLWTQMGFGYGVWCSYSDDFSSWSTPERISPEGFRLNGPDTKKPQGIGDWAVQWDHRAWTEYDKLYLFAVTDLENHIDSTVGIIDATDWLP